MLIFYYGLLFLGTLSITDGVATFILIALIDFFIGKTIWQDYKPFVTWRKKKYKQLIKLKKQAKKSFLKKWKKEPLLKRAYIIVAGLVGFALLILFVHLYLEILLFNWNTTETTAKEDSSIRNLAIAFLGATSGIGALFGVYLAIRRTEESKRQNDTAEQGLITDRINKAVESLGKVNQKGESILEVRIGALYALERIAQDSIRDHIRIMKIICAYIYVINPLIDSRDSVDPVGEDVRTALIIIGLRGEWTEDQRHLKNEEKQGYWLDLRNCNLHNADLNDTNLNNANLTNATLERAHLDNATLHSTRCNGANFTKADIIGTDFKNTFTRYSLAHECDFSRCLNLTQEQIDVMYCGIDVIIPDNLTRPGHWPIDELTYDDFIESYEEWIKTKK